MYSPRGKREQTTGNKKCQHLCNFMPIIIDHHEKCIQISTYMPAIGFVIREIAFERLNILSKQNDFAW